MIRLNFTPFPLLKTGRTLLREMKHEDIHEYHILRTDDEINRYIDGSRPQSQQDTLAIIHRMNNNVATNKSIAWTIADPDTQKMIGSICIWNMEGHDDCWELGYSMLSEHQGKGLMKEALDAAVDYGFKEMNLPVIHAYTHMDNQPSTRLLEKAGFQRNKDREAKLTDPAEIEHTVVYTLYRGG